MRRFLIAPDVEQISFVSMVLLALAAITTYRLSSYINRRQILLGLGLILLLAIGLTFASLGIGYTRIAGTRPCTARGWPHFFYESYGPDLLDHTAPGPGHYDFGGGGYVLVNVLFYSGVAWFLLLLWLRFKARGEAGPV